MRMRQSTIWANYLCAAAGLLLCFPAPSADAARVIANIAPNAGLMGSGAAVVDWYTHTMAGRCLFDRHPGSGPEGETAVSVRGETADSVGRWYTDVSVLPGATYGISVWIRTEGNTRAGVMLSAEDQVEGSSPEQWSRLQLRYSVPSDRLSFRMHLQQYGQGRVLFSRPEVVLTQMPAAGPTEPIPALGGAIEAIVIPEAPDPVQTACALELRRIFRALTGKTVAIRSDTPAGRAVFVGVPPSGRDYASRLAMLSHDGIILDVDRRAVVCLGRTPQGVYNAVAELLYRMGCLWIWPGKYGECLPPKGPIPLPRSLRLTHNPPFQLRGGHLCHLERPVGGSLQHVDVGEWVDWAARNRYNRAKGCYSSTWPYGAMRGGGWQEVSGHSTTELLLPAEMFEDHPEWFALYRGRRVATHPIGTTAMPCIGNPDVQEHFAQRVIEYFNTHPDAQRYVVGANDEPSYWCECDRCKALDPPGVKWRLNGTREMLPMTDRWLTLVNSVAARVAAVHPGKWIGTFAYGSTRSLPERVKPLPNVMIEYTLWDRCFRHDLLDARCPVNAQGVVALRSWGAVAPALAIYGYLDYLYPGIPLAYWRSDYEAYRSLHRLGVRYVSDEIDTVPSASPLLIAYRMRLLWDLNTDPDCFAELFCRAAYGRAARVMRAFWDTQADAVYRSAAVHPGINDLSRYTPQIMARSYRLLDEAARLVNREPPEVQARIARARMSLDQVTYYLTQAKIDAGDTSQWLELMQTRQAILDASAHWGLHLDSFTSDKLGGSYPMPKEALGGRTLLQLPEQWLFRTDPEDAGEREGWFAPHKPLNDWKPISVWKPWELQGHEGYDGLAWYALDITLPAASERKRVWLLFGAVDDSWTLWLNGRLLGRSTIPPAEAWDKPFAVEITGLYSPGQKHRLVMRVGDAAGMGGIWRPVTVVESD